tara:strand:- start:78 stop:470 length:393 start_codon:yes stop_codon:yes gene_type:complete
MKYYLLFFIVFWLPSNLDAQVQKDSLFIKYDLKYLKKVKDPKTSSSFYILTEKGKNGSFWFSEEINPVETTTKFTLRLFQNILQKACFYTYKDNQKLRNNYMVYKFFKNYNIFLVKGNDIIELEPNYAIE